MVSIIIIKSKNFTEIVATLNGSSRVLKVTDIIEQGPVRDSQPCDRASMALKTWWLTSISLMDRNEECGPGVGNW